VKGGVLGGNESEGKFFFGSFFFKKELFF